MQIVIELDEKFYEWLMTKDDTQEVVYKAVRKGIPLPTEHGDLIDRNLLRTKVWSDSERRKDSLFGDGERLCLTMIDEATPVVPANNHSESYNEWLNSTTNEGTV